MSKLDEILTYAVAAIDLNVPSVDEDIAGYKQQIKALMLDLITTVELPDAATDEVNYYISKLRQKVEEL